ncbi:LAMI_0D06194g1_1 [Lachancea mirantina]|uniref:LAMI_0D06194g1_1 n=1 Tax=Lachancea mirantina TaxID=1230905 RepID=A0A1G4JBI4_9SACH|nr:LAMI_0D06194g1_1 [Lachancea mirantina]
MSEEVPLVVDVQVSETINSALDQLQLDDLTDASGVTDALVAAPAPVPTAPGASPSTNVFPHPQMMGIGFMHYPHMMPMRHSPGFYPPSENDAGTESFSIGMEAPKNPVATGSAGSAGSAGADGATAPSAGPLGATPPAPVFPHLHPPGAGLNHMGFSATGADPLWSSGEPHPPAGGADYSFMGTFPKDSETLASTRPSEVAARRQTFPAISDSELMDNGTASVRNHSISIEKSEPLKAFKQPTKETDQETEPEASNIALSAAAYPYGGPLMQPNSVVSSHYPPTAAPGYGMPSPFGAYGFSSPFQSFSPLPGTPIVDHPANSSPSNVVAGVGDMKELPENGNNPPPGSRPPTPWIYGNHPFGHMMPIHHQMMNQGGVSGHHFHGSQHAGHHSHQPRRHRHNQNSKQPYRRGEDPSKYANAKLDDYIGNIYSLCKDQHGCRFLQRQLDIDGTKAATSIFEEVKEHVVELMTDSFGNYLIQKLLERVSDEQRLTLVKSSAQSFVEVSLDPHGTRALQKLVECINCEEEAKLIVDSLSGSVAELSRDLNGNHVVQKCLQKLNANDTQFIFDAACHDCVKIATHRHGCCVLQRCLDHSSKEQSRQLCENVVSNVDLLATDPFGNYVIQYILTKEAESRDSEYTNKIVNILRPKIIELSLHKFGSNVAEKILRTPSVSEVMINELVARGGEIGVERLLHDAYGNYVLQTALDISREKNRYLYQKLSDALGPLLVGPVRNTPHGRRIIGILEIDS